MIAYPEWGSVVGFIVDFVVAGLDRLYRVYKDETYLPGSFFKSRSVRVVAFHPHFPVGWLDGWTTSPYQGNFVLETQCS